MTTIEEAKLTEESFNQIDSNQLALDSDSELAARESRVEFCGLTFDLNGDRTQPINQYVPSP